MYQVIVRKEKQILLGRVIVLNNNALHTSHVLKECSQSFIFSKRIKIFKNIYAYLNFSIMQCIHLQNCKLHPITTGKFLCVS